MGRTKHTCPRDMDRADSPFRGAGTNLDTYAKRHGLIGQGRGCSYCGSMHPDDFMEAVRTGCRIGVTSKSYKLYVEGHSSNGPNGGKFYTGHLTEEQGWEFDRLWGEGKINFDYRPPRLFIPGPSTQTRVDR